MFSFIFSSFIVPFGISVAITLALLLTFKFHGEYSLDTNQSIQKNHKRPTCRIGGLAIFVSIFVAWLLSKSDHSSILGPLLISSLPAFVFGFAEDLTKRISITARMLATMFSGFLGWILTGYSISGVDIPMVDIFLSYKFFSIFFTVISISGLANAVNIIDGVNGLASGFLIFAMLALAAVANALDDNNLSFVCIAIASAVLGFFVFNWPFGKIFLGDGGSYLGGFSFAWTSILLVERNSSVTAFVPLLICIYPVTEVLFSIYRRKVRKRSIGHPDRLHLHSLLMRRFVRLISKRFVSNDLLKSSLCENSITGLLMLLICIPTVVSSLLVIQNPELSAFLCFVFVVVYLTIYARLVRFRWCSPIAFLLPKKIFL